MLMSHLGCCYVVDINSRSSFLGVNAGRDFSVSGKRAPSQTITFRKLWNLLLYQIARLDFKMLLSMVQAPRNRKLILFYEHRGHPFDLDVATSKEQSRNSNSSSLPLAFETVSRFRPPFKNGGELCSHHHPVAGTMETSKFSFPNLG